MFPDALAAACIFGAAAIAAMRRIPDGEIREGSSPVFLMVIVLVLSCFGISAWRGADFHASFEKIIFFSACAALVATLTRTTARYFEPVWLLVSAGIGVYALSEFFVPGGIRFDFPFAIFLLAAVPVIHDRLKSAEAGFLPEFFLVAAIFGAMACRSLSVSILLVGYFGLDAWRRHPNARIWTAGAVLVLSALLLHGLQPESFFRFSDPGHPLRRQVDCWETAFLEFRSAPIFGVGPGNFDLLCGQHGAGVRTYAYAQGAPMTILAECGIVGALGCLGLATQLVLWLISQQRRYGPSLGLLFLLSLVDPVFEIPSTALLFFVLLGLSARPPRLSPAIWRLGLGGFATAGLAFSLAILGGRYYHDTGMRLANQGRSSTENLEAALDSFSRAGGLWPRADEDAALGRVHYNLAAREIFEPDRRRQHLRFAQSHFERAARKSPNRPAIRAALGETFLALGESDRAAFQFREASRLDPRGPAVGKYLQILAGNANG